ncbi:Glycosyltransferase involved in cell wall bisynthesis [Actinokineospora iranica]|uniref:Glycosyltransferase involved in cell wall bisynthesis n=1 Tax=Actinokineospora iranica TaxID=1271860 RepID=A0A1G6W039_9PSEU|nr:Glycosyltransferase involved in cell wall bisynthesis [Actinokineospora iranica]
MTPPERTSPLVSCLMVTRDRPTLADRAIRCFAHQRYTARELVIVTQGTAAYRNQLLESTRAHGVERVEIVQADPTMRLGALRNLSLDVASGDLVCVWDDDDCSHPDRLTIQVGELISVGAHTSFLSDHLQLFQQDGDLHWIDWTLPTPPAKYPLLPTTMLMTRDTRFHYPESGRYAHFGEDWALLTELHNRVRVQHVSGHGHLYLYTYHGRNTFPAAHHGKFRIRSRTRAQVAARESDIRAAMAYYAVPSPVLVHGSDGPVFAI